LQDSQFFELDRETVKFSCNKSIINRDVKLTECHVICTFHLYHVFFFISFSVISKLVRRGYQDHLADLLLQVNFNSYYTTAVIQSW